MKIEHENEFIKKLTSRLSKGGFDFKVKLNDVSQSGMHPTLKHYMVWERIYKSANVTVYTDLTYYDVSPYILPLEDDFDISIYIEVQKL